MNERRVVIYWYKLRLILLHAANWIFKSIHLYEHPFEKLIFDIMYRNTVLQKQ